MDIVLIVVTLVSLVVAAVMSFVAWRVVRDERLRSNARVATLAADIRSEDVDLALAADTPVASSGMFAYVQPARALPRLAAVLGGGAIVFIGGASLLVALGRGSHDVAPGAAESVRVVDEVGPEASASYAAARALELVALGHERDKDRLVVRGVIRNPVDGSAVTQVTAVVMLFNHEGGFLATGRAEVQQASLEPGGETTFLVTVPGAADVGRYRVSFRAEDRVIPHVDVRS